MSGKNVEKRLSVKNFLYLFFFLIIIWLALTSTFQWQELIVGILISLILTFFLNKNYIQLGLPVLSICKIFYIIVYIIVLFIEIVKANFDVAYRVINPSMPIKPGIVIIKTELKQDIAKMILANSITLTPGTFTLDIKGDNLLIHWIYVRSEDVEQSTKQIGQRFEKYLIKIFK